MVAKILVVDSDARLASRLGQYFGAELAAGVYQFCFEASGQQALRRLRTEPPPQVLLLSVHLPDLPAARLLHEAGELLAHSRIIVLAAQGELASVRAALRGGALDFLYKPLDMGDVAATLAWAAWPAQVASGSQVQPPPTLREPVASYRVPVPAAVGPSFISTAPAQAPLLLLVDDQPARCLHLARALAANYRLLTAADAEQGWQLAQQVLPDAVLVTATLPAPGGPALAARIGAAGATAHVAVVLLAPPEAPAEAGYAPRDPAALGQHLRALLGRPAPVPAPPSISPVHERWLRQLYALLDQHLDKSDLNVEWLATQLLMCRKTLLRRLHTLLRLSPREVIQRHRLRRAAELLRAGHLVAEAAYAVGFNTPAYFGQCFKEFYQLTPSQFAASAPSMPAA